jgi:chemotaxis protein CheD
MLPSSSKPQPRPASKARAGAYQDRRFTLPLVSLMPGACDVSRGEIGFTTVLGSCVAACIWDELRGIGGMNHFLLPEGVDIDPTHSGWAKAARYGNHAMELLVNRVLESGARRENMVAKVFGGGAVIATVSSLVGQRNAEFVLRYLDVEHIPVIAEDLGGQHPRQVYFFPSSGEAFVKKLKSADQQLILREMDFAKKVQKDEPQGSIFLF